MGFVGWARRMRTAFGAPFLWLVSIIYFTQGFRSFVWTAVSYQMKEMLKLPPSTSQFLVSIAFVPWSIKPIYGIISDCVPIRGKKRIPYLFLATVLSLFPWLLLGLIASLRNSRNVLTGFLLLQNLGSAMADVVIDAMIAEAVRSELAAFSGDLQSLSWSIMALGGIFGSLLGGYTLSNLRINTIFLLFSALPTIQLFSCTLVKETRSQIPKFSNINNHNNVEPDMEFSSGSSSYIEKRRVGISRRQKNGHTSNKSNVVAMKSESIERQHRSEASRLLISLKSAVYSLCQAFRQPIILRPMAWFFFSHITVPNLSTVMFYYQTDVLHLEASFLGTSRVVSWLGLMVGTYTYNRYLKRMRLRRILMWSHIGLAIINLLDIVVVSRLNVQFGILDKYMVLCGSALGDAINQFKMMPFLILSGQLCPPGIEGTLFALFMSINNLGSTVGSFFGAALASLLNISSGSYDKLAFGIAVQLLATLVPIGFLFLIPREATGLAS